jgi:hypothetical protein
MNLKTKASHIIFLTTASVSLNYSAVALVLQNKMDGSKLSPNVSTNIISAAPTINVKQCTQAVSAAKLKLQKIDQLQLISIKKIKATQSSYINYPSNRPFIYSIIMNGLGGENTMNSPKIIQEIGSRIITYCPSVAAVTFGIDQTDWGQMVGIVNNEKIEEFKCVDSDPRKRTLNTKLQWGTRICL